MRTQGQANCPLLNEPRQIQANSRGDRDGTERLPLVQVCAFAAERKQNASQRSDRLTLPTNTLGLQTMEQRLTSARIESRLANFPIYVYDLQIPLPIKYKPLKLGNTDPIALTIVTHISTVTARAVACHRQASACAAKQARPKAALACNNYYGYNSMTPVTFTYIQMLRGISISVHPGCHSNNMQKATFLLTAVYNYLQFYQSNELLTWVPNDFQLILQFLYYFIGSGSLVRFPPIQTLRDECCKNESVTKLLTETCKELLSPINFRTESYVSFRIELSLSSYLK